jgi:hypothetical protein
LKGLVATVAAAAALVLASGVSADPLRYGAADDWPKFHPCGDVWWRAVTDVGLTEVRMTLQWNGGTVVPFQAEIQDAVDCAALNGVTPILAVYPGKPAMIGSKVAAQKRFAQFVALVGQTFPGITNFVIGNEPNVNRFWQPQFVKGKDAAGRDYEHTLARSYDALKAVRPDAVVWGPAISSRGNDNAHARSAPSHSPVWFIKDLVDAYRASGRTRPLFDVFDMHPYPPVQDTTSYAKSFAWPQAGAANLDRIKQALWDAFHGTAQATPTESHRTDLSRTAPQALPINLDEVGSQTVDTGHADAYDDPPESIRAIPQATQTRYYVQLMQMAACDPAVSSLLFFPVIDDSDLHSGFQSGLLFADLTPKLSYEAVKKKIAAAQGLCDAKAAKPWVHTTGIAGAHVSFSGTGSALHVAVTAKEDVTYQADVVPAPHGRGTNGAAVSLAREQRGGVHGRLRAYRSVTRGLPQTTLPAGSYVDAVKLTSVVAPGRSVTVVSAPFKVVVTSGNGNGRHNGHGKGGAKGKGAKHK